MLNDPPICRADLLSVIDRLESIIETMDRQIESLTCALALAREQRAASIAREIAALIECADLRDKLAVARGEGAGWKHMAEHGLAAGHA